MPPDVVLECISEDRVQVEEGASLEARALPSSSCAHQHIREENKKTISLLSTPFLFQNKEEWKGIKIKTRNHNQNENNVDKFV